MVLLVVVEVEVTAVMVGWMRINQSINWIRISLDFEL